MSEVPYVIGQWVCGARFYGRENLIAGLLGEPRRWDWIAGLRRIGKTSLLKQLEHRAGSDARRLPLYWDLQGVGGLEELGLTFGDALLDAEEALARRGISPAEVEDGDVFAALEKLSKALERRGAELLLLCDEADELTRLDQAVPGLVARLWQTVGGLDARVVLASSLRLCDSGPAEWMERFGAPRYLGAMTDGEARDLLLQSRLPEAARPALAPSAAEALRERCGNHPMLLQLAGKRFHELGDLPETFRQLDAERTVRHLFAVDFDLLTDAERAALRSLAGSPEAPVPDAAVQRLLQLGLLCRRPGGLTIPSGFLASWLQGS
jgi:hypothetical protein